MAASISPGVSERNARQLDSEMQAVPDYYPPPSLIVTSSPSRPTMSHPDMASLNAPAAVTKSSSCLSSYSGTTIDNQEVPHPGSLPTNIPDEAAKTAEPSLEVASSGAALAMTGDVPTAATSWPDNANGSLAPMPVSYFVARRYENRCYLPFKPEDDIKMIPAKNKFATLSRPSILGRGWKRHEHPEGQLYFSYATRRYYTNAYLYDDESRADIERAVDMMEAELKYHTEILSKTLHIGLEIYVRPETREKLVCYYICDVAAEEVFWLVDCSIDWVVREENLPVYEPEHLSISASWFINCREHVYMFPYYDNDRVVTEDSVRELRNVLSYHLLDRETSRTSNAPYSADDLHRFTQIISDIKFIGDYISAYDVVKIARMKAALCIEQFRQYHGTKWARLASDRSVHRNVTEQSYSWWFLILSWLFFCTPALYVKRIDHMWVDFKINHQPWRKFIREIQENWQDSITPSTVILAVDVGFLAIQSIDQGGNWTGHRSAGQIISYISTLLSIGNIIACTILARQHRSSAHLYAEDALNYLAERASKRWRIEMLAIILSIPTAFFIWALLTFLAAILWVCFDKTSTTTWAIISSVTLFMVFFIALVIANGDWDFLSLHKALEKIRIPNWSMLSTTEWVAGLMRCGALYRPRKPPQAEEIRMAEDPSQHV
ncbi:hypothetical protein BD414DRAFT_467138 [Trametes punicea]|nr:hypothetical protein BD414DRAFT_467138 [Trametes punicea]